MGTNDPIRPVQAPRVRPVPAGDRGKIRRHQHEESQEQSPRKRGGRSGDDQQRNEEGGIDAYV